MPSRVIVRPLKKLGTRMSRKIQAIVDSFEEVGSSSHTRMAMTLQPIIDHCEKTNQGFALYAMPDGGGYAIEKIDLAFKRVWNNEQLKKSMKAASTEIAQFYSKNSTMIPRAHQIEEIIMKHAFPKK
jgi:hypothetical protein